MQELLQNQELLWVLTVVYDLGLAIILYRFFGKYGLYAAVILGIVLGNLQGGKVSQLEFFGYSFTASMGAILYSGIYFATDILNEKYGKKEENNGQMYKSQQPIAIVGMGCHFPKNIESPSSFWEALSNKTDLVNEIPFKRWPENNLFTKNKIVSKIELKFDCFYFLFFQILLTHQTKFLIAFLTIFFCDRLYKVFWKNLFFPFLLWEFYMIHFCLKKAVELVFFQCFQSYNWHIN